MKLTLSFFLLSATAAFAGPTENITGCETKPIANSNATQFVDPTCYKPVETSGDNILTIFAATAAALPEEEASVKDH
jgi:hypothetical protein